MKRTALKAKPRSKGNRGELEVIEIYKAHGWPARRNWQSGGQGGADIIGGPPGTSTEVKHQETVRMKEWTKQCAAAAKPTDIPIVAHRINRAPWHAVIPLEDYDALDKDGRSSVRVKRQKARVSLWDWIDQANELAGEFRPGALSVVDFKWPDTGWYTDLPLEDLCSLLKAAEA